MGERRGIKEIVKEVKGVLGGKVRYKGERGGGWIYWKKEERKVREGVGRWMGV